MPDKLAVIQSEETIKELSAIEAKVVSLVDNFKKLVSEGDKISAGLLKGTPKEFLNSLKEAEQLNKQYTQTLKDLATAEAKLAQVEASRAKISVENARAKKEEANAEAAAAKAKREAANAEKAELQLQERKERQARTMTGPYKQFSTQVLEAKKRAKDLGAEMILLEQSFKRGEITKRQYNKELDRLAKEFTEAKVTAMGLDKQVKKLDASLGDHQRNVGNYQSALGGITKSFRSALGAFGVVGGVSMFAGIVQSSYEAIKKLDAMNYALNQVFESEAQVGFQKEYLQGITQRYGLELLNTTQAYTKYSAAVKGSTLEGEEARKIFTAFSAAASKLGLNAEQSTGIFRALEQMISKGKVNAEELRLQLGDRMPGAFKLFADAMGITTAELDKMLKDGKLLSAEVLPKVAEQLGKMYNLNEETDTLAAAQNRLKNEWTAFLDTIIGNKEIMDGLAETFGVLSEVLEFLLETLIVKGKDGNSVLGDLIDTIRIFVGSIDDIGRSLGFVDEKQKNTLLSMNAFKNDLAGLQSLMNAVSKTVVYLGEVIANLFNISGGLGAWMERMDAATERVVNSWKKHEEVAKQIAAANKRGEALEQKTTDKYTEAWNKARKAKQAYFQLNGKYFDTATGRNTGKSLDDYIDRDGKLVKKQKVSPVGNGNDDGKKKKHQSPISREERDAVNAAVAERDNAIARLKEQKLEMQIGEREYWEAYIKVQQQYRAKIFSILNDANGAKQRLTAQARKKAVDEIEKANSEIYKYELDGLNKRRKLAEAETENRLKEIENDPTLMETERLTRANKVYNEMIDRTAIYYAEKIRLARENAQELINIEAERDAEILKIQTKQQDSAAKLPGAMMKDREYYESIEKAYRAAGDAERRAAILSNSKLKQREKDYLLAVEENKTQLHNYELDKARLQGRQKELELKADQQTITAEESKELAETVQQIGLINAGIAETNEQLKKTNLDKLREDWAYVLDSISSGFNDAGLPNLSAQVNKVFDEIINKTFDWRDATLLAAAAVADALQNFSQITLEKRIADLDEQLKHSRATTDQETEFINQRLTWLNSLEEKTAEQIEERNALEDEARVLKEQQLQREKMIATQKAKAEQKAAANQALINGALAAAKTLANLGVPVGLAPAAVAMLFGAAQAAVIMSKDPVPKYFVGRDGGPAEWAWTQEKGREIITDKDGRVKSYGSDGGAAMTWLEKGDKVYTADQTAEIIKGMADGPAIRWDKIARESMAVPVIIPRQQDNSAKIINGVEKAFDKVMNKYDKTVYFTDERGNIYSQQGGQYPIYRGRERRPIIRIKDHGRN